MEKLWGIKPLSMLGKTPFDVMPPEYRARGQEYFGALIKEMKSFEGLISSAVLPDNRIVYVETSGVPFFDPGGKLLGYRGISRDITDRKLAEEALQKAKDELEIRVQERTSELSQIAKELRISEEAYRFLVEFNPVGVFRHIYNPLTGENKRLHCNEALLRILGYSSIQEYLNGMPTEVANSEGNWNTFIRKLLDDGNVINYPDRLRRTDGSTIWVLLNANARTHKGDIIIEGAMTDITAQKKTEERLRKAQKNLRAMASEIVMAQDSKSFLRSVISKQCFYNYRI
jgi:PAS domain S-box-containing protein